MSEVIDGEERAVVVQRSALPAAVTVDQLVGQVTIVQDAARRAMKEGLHFGKIPGTDKPTLLKPGAEVLGLLFGLHPDFVVTQEDLGDGHREISVKCVLKSKSGNAVGSGLGSCSTKESKYRWRTANLKCPTCGKETIIKGKAEYGGGYICFAKRGGCGAKFGDSDPTIVDQPRGKVENPDIADLYNTVLKMAKKRAHIDAILTTTAASDVFTQDMEDFQPEPSPVRQPQAPIEDDLPDSMQTSAEKLKAAAKMGKTYVYDVRKAPSDMQSVYTSQLLESGAEKDSKGNFHSITDLGMNEILLKGPK